MLYTENYKQQLQIKHDKVSWGGGVGTKVKWIIPKAKTYLNSSINTILDYGCGNGSFKKTCNELFPDISVLEYDPGIINKSICPDKADIVVCFDVLEHVEPECLSDVLSHIQSINTYGAVLQPCLVAAGHTLSDGRNAHLIIQDGEWWLNRFEDYFTIENILYNTPSHLAVFVKNNT